MSGVKMSNEFLQRCCCCLHRHNKDTTDGEICPTKNNNCTSDNRNTQESQPRETQESHPRETQESQRPPDPQVEDVYTAVYEYEARAEHELSFKKGELFRVIHRSGEWWTVEKMGQGGNVLATGIIPRNFLVRGRTLEAQPWYFGKLNRLQAEKLLMAPLNGNGAFLMRVSEKDTVGHVLSVKYGGQVKHFKILRLAELFYVNMGHNFHSLRDLVDYYTKNPLISMGSLGRPCIQQVKPELYDLSHITVDQWELPKEQFTCEKKLGNGHFGEVFQGKWKSKVMVAIKILKNDNSPDHDEFRQETTMLKKLRHKNIVSLFAICTSSLPFFIITEFMEKGDMKKFLKGAEGKSLILHNLIEMTLNVVEGMAYLESENIIHRDLAARNVLVGANCVCKVADFGLARIIKEPFYLAQNTLIPFKWASPEALNSRKFSSKSDVWSFGVLLYEIVTYGSDPYPSYRNDQMLNLLDSGYRMPCPPNCPDSIYNVMMICWKKLPEERPNFNELRTNLNSIQLPGANVAKMENISSVFVSPSLVY